MKRVSYLFLAFLLSIFTLAADSKKKSPFKHGAGQFEYTEYAPLAKKPITVFYYIPMRGNIKKMPVLISMHGAERNGLVQRGAWRNLAEEYGFIVIAPQFTHDNGYLENDYQFGGVTKSSKDHTIKPREEWTYSIIENLFDYFLECTQSTVKTYDMFGHSAGGQFVHRYLLTNPQARVRRAVAANPGNYTYPDENGLFSDEGVAAEIQTWPFTVKDTPFIADSCLSAFFNRDLVILIGSQDITPQQADKPANNSMLVQGKTRYERAYRFFNHAREIARKKNMAFNWRIREVPGAEHNSGHMIYGTPDVRSKLLPGKERVWDLRDLTNYGAYSILFEE
ncbi:MAG: alpha/beta hydrolase [Muribaculaceae bacterium]|nr:alpha/beta hydrolase [Muribaculaceae bacterium]